MRSPCSQSEALREERQLLTDWIADTTTTDEHIRSVTEVAAAVQDRLEDADFALKRQLVELLNCTLANLMAMQYDDGDNQGIDSICLDGGSQAPVAFAPPRTRSVMGMRRMAPGAYGSTTGGSVHLRLAGTRHWHRSGPRHTLAPARCLRRAGRFRVARKPCVSCR